MNKRSNIGRPVGARLRAAAAAAATALALLTAVGDPAHADAPSTASATALAGICTSYPLPVALTAGGPVDQHVAVHLCVPYQAVERGRIDVFVHGATSNQTYWDWPQDP